MLILQAFDVNDYGSQKAYLTYSLSQVKMTRIPQELWFLGAAKRVLPPQKSSKIHHKKILIVVSTRLRVFWIWSKTSLFLSGQRGGGNGALRCSTRGSEGELEVLMEVQKKGEIRGCKKVKSQFLQNKQSFLDPDVFSFFPLLPLILLIIKLDLF